ncbi:MAG: 3-isopropylmalate dehydrogenase [Bacillota bacterium]|nr:3-isopropylmalate dehydrogenase [Bacillota bacterium]
MSEAEGRGSPQGCRAEGRSPARGGQAEGDSAARALVVAVLPGDGIGPEVTAQAVKALEAAAAVEGLTVRCRHLPVGGTAIEEAGEPLPDEVLRACRQADAVLLGAVGGPRWDGLPAVRRPEAGLLALRQGLGLWANLRPVKLHPALAGTSPLRGDLAARGLDIMVVRELSGGLYYGKPSGRWADGSGYLAVDTMWYQSRQIERVARLAFELAAGRAGRLTSVDKANVLSTSRLWRERVENLHPEYPGVAVEHMYVDAAAMEMVLRPWRLDVLVTENTFGDILSDLGGALVGSLGLLPSASLGDDGPGLFEPVHGSAPALAGQDRANPVGAILSAALLLRYCGAGEHGLRAALRIEAAVGGVLEAGYRTPDLEEPGSRLAATAGYRAVGTATMGDLVVEAIREG